MRENCHESLLHHWLPLRLCESSSGPNFRGQQSYWFVCTRSIWALTRRSIPHSCMFVTCALCVCSNSILVITYHFGHFQCVKLICAQTLVHRHRHRRKTTPFPTRFDGTTTTWTVRRIYHSPLHTIAQCDAHNMQFSSMARILHVSFTHSIRFWIKNKYKTVRSLARSKQPFLFSICSNFQLNKWKIYFRIFFYFFLFLPLISAPCHSLVELMKSVCVNHLPKKKQNEERKRIYLFNKLRYVFMYCYGLWLIVIDVLLNAYSMSISVTETEFCWNGKENE